MEPQPSPRAPSILQVAGALATMAVGIALVGALAFLGGVVCLVSLPVLALIALTHVAGSRLLKDRYWRFLARSLAWCLRRPEGTPGFTATWGPAPQSQTQRHWDAEGVEGGPIALPDRSGAREREPGH